jgi:hypothetical protein
MNHEAPLSQPLSRNKRPQPVRNIFASLFQRVTLLPRNKNRVRPPCAAHDAHDAKIHKSLRHQQM